MAGDGHRRTPGHHVRGRIAKLKTAITTTACVRVFTLCVAATLQPNVSPFLRPALLPHLARPF